MHGSPCRRVAFNSGPSVPAQRVATECLRRSRAHAGGLGCCAAGALRCSRLSPVRAWGRSARLAGAAPGDPSAGRGVSLWHLDRRGPDRRHGGPPGDRDTAPRCDASGFSGGRHGAGCAPARRATGGLPPARPRRTTASRQPVGPDAIPPRRSCGNAHSRRDPARPRVTQTARPAGARVRLTSPRDPSTTDRSAEARSTQQGPTHTQGCCHV